MIDFVLIYKSSLLLLWLVTGWRLLFGALEALWNLPFGWKSVGLAAAYVLMAGLMFSAFTSMAEELP